MSSEIEVSGSGFLPNSPVEVYVYSNPYLLGILNADDNGEFASIYSLPNGLDPGSHKLELVGIGTDNSERKVEYSFKLIDRDNPTLYQERGMFDDAEGSAKTIGGLAAVAAAVAAAGAAGAAAGASTGGSSGSGSTAPTAHRVAIAAARGTSSRFTSSSSSENVTDDEIESLETSHDTFLSEDRAWGDNLSLWRKKYMTVWDSWWTKATINTAQFSPFISKIESAIDPTNN